MHEATRTICGLTRLLSKLQFRALSEPFYALLLLVWKEKCCTASSQLVSGLLSGAGGSLTLSDDGSLNSGGENMQTEKQKVFNLLKVLITNVINFKF